MPSFRDLIADLEWDGLIRLLAFPHDRREQDYGFWRTTRVVATAPDGIIEAIEDPAARFSLGVQWHPENLWRTGEFRPLFEGFIEAAAKS